MSGMACGCDIDCKGGPYYCDRHRLKVPLGGGSMVVYSDKPRLTVNNTPAPTRATTLPVDAAQRKQFPVATGVLDYFPDALVAVAHVSKVGNDQHNPGESLHWAREKSTDQTDTMIRHYLERGTRDADGQRHTAKMVWRALAILQLEIEAEQGG